MPSTPERNLLYLVRRAALRRCNDTRDPDYHRYGARGIEMCEEWTDHPKAFVEWALANGYRHGLYLDRKDSDGPYSPANCRFVTPSESSRNRRANIEYTYNRRTQCLAAWAEERGIKYETFRKRWHRGWRGDRLMTAP